MEREEAYDLHLLEQQKKTGFLPAHRPWKWRKMCLDLLKESIFEKVEANQLETRAENKMWLVRHLEVIRIIMLEDLRTAKKHLVHCFPPEQNIFLYILSLYHEAITKQILRVRAAGLEGTEFVSLLQWILQVKMRKMCRRTGSGCMQVYPGPELLGHDSLQLAADLVPALLSEEEVEELVAVYLDTMATNYEVWMGNTIRQEQEDWVGDLEPETDVDNCYYTSTPVLINRFCNSSSGSLIIHLGIWSGWSRITSWSPRPYPRPW